MLVCCYYLLLLNISITQNRWLSLLFRFTQINTKCVCVHYSQPTIHFFSLFVDADLCHTHLFIFFWDRITFTYLNYYGLLTAKAKKNVDLRKFNHMLGVVKMIFFLLHVDIWLRSRLEFTREGSLIAFKKKIRDISLQNY